MKQEVIHREMQAEELLRIAHQFGAAACQLRPGGREAGWVAYRFCITHAIELCLSALLLHQGHDWREICRMKHDLALRAERCAVHDLKLRKKSIALLQLLSQDEVYRRLRYGHVTASDHLHPNQFLALFAETAEKVCALISRTLPKS